MVAHTAFPKCITTATKATTNTTTRVHVTKAVTGTRQYIELFGQIQSYQHSYQKTDIAHGIKFEFFVQ